MNWLSSFYLKHPEYRKLRVARRTPTSIHFELEPGLYEAHFHIKPIFKRVASGLWLPAGQFAALGRMIAASVRNPRLAAEIAMSLPFATTLTLQPDAAAGIDTTIYQGSSNQNNGVWDICAIGNVSTGATAYRLLIKFDLSGLPSSAIISSATFSLYCMADDSASAHTCRVFRQKRAWLEGTRSLANDTPATGATWARYDTVNNWQTAGGFGADDCEQTDIGLRAFAITETLNQFKDFVLTPTTKAGLDLGNGWLVKMDTEQSDRYSFASGDNATAAYRPKLVVNYTLPAGGAAFNAPFASPFRGAFG